MTGELAPSIIHRPQSREEGNDLIRRLRAEGFSFLLTVYDAGQGVKLVDAVGIPLAAMEDASFKPYMQHILGDEKYDDVQFIQSPPDWHEDCLSVMVKVKGLSSGTQEKPAGQSETWYTGLGAGSAGYLPPQLNRKREDL